MNPPLFHGRAHLPRLPAEHYRGCAFVHWTMTVDQRQSGWLNREFHEHFRLVMLHALARHRLACPVYCLMPDHLHLIWTGISPASDQRLACAFFRKYVNSALQPRKLQLQAFDHVLRARERLGDALAKIADYILQNPVRAQLCQSWREYPYSNALVAGYPDLDVRQSDSWEIFWRIYNRLVAAG
jgi:REP element-mobilizing transposase RayT